MLFYCLRMLFFYTELGKGYKQIIVIPDSKITSIESLRYPLPYQHDSNVLICGKTSALAMQRSGFESHWSNFVWGFLSYFGKIPSKRCLKTVDTIGNCQRLVFTVGVSQHMHKIINLWKLSSIGRRSCEIIMKEKNTLVTRNCVLSDAWFRDLKF